MPTGRRVFLADLWVTLREERGRPRRHVDVVLDAHIGFVVLRNAIDFESGDTSSRYVSVEYLLLSRARNVPFRTVSLRRRETDFLFFSEYRTHRDRDLGRLTPLSPRRREAAHDCLPGDIDPREWGCAIVK